MYTSQSSNNMDPNLVNSLNNLTALGLIIFAIMLCIAITWVWSMISMINLNSKFGEFLELYKEREGRRGTFVASDNGNESVDQSKVDEPLAKTEDTQSWKDLRSHPGLTALLLTIGVAIICVTLYMMLS